MKKTFINFISAFVVVILFNNYAYLQTCSDLTPAFISGVNIICLGETTILYGNGTNGSTAPSGDPTLTHQWQASSMGVYNNVAGTSLTYSPGALTTTTGFRLVTTTDAFSDCSDTSNVIFVTVNSFSINITPTDPNCPNTDGIASATVSSGSGSYSYLWSNGQMTLNATGLEGGTSYTLTVTDNISSCTGTSSVTLTSCGPNANVPTLSQWSLIILSLMMCILGIIGVKSEGYGGASSCSSSKD